MHFTVHHKFDSLSAKHGGKQHHFTWRSWDKAAQSSHVVAHAMYQSGEDQISTHDGNSSKRGQVIRLQFEENGNCAPGHGLEIKIDDATWKASDYQNLARFILNDAKADGAPLNQEQKVAAMSQLASLYNLMATQWGEAYTVGMDKPKSNEAKDIAQALDGMVTDRKLQAVSRWFETIAADMLQGKTPQTDNLSLPSKTSRSGSPSLRWEHQIEASDGAKFHRFNVELLRYPNAKPEDGRDPTSPKYPYRRLVEAGYNSGPTGEKLAVFALDPNDPTKADIQHGLPLQVRLGADALHTMTDKTIDSPMDAVPLAENVKHVKRALDEGSMDQQQAIASLVLLASLYRLVATGYNSGYGYDHHGASMTPHFFDDPASDTGSAAAKIHALRLNQGRGETTDMTIHNGQFFTRPKSITDRKSLRHYVNDPFFSNEADKALAMAAAMVKGTRIESLTDETRLPQWKLGKQLTETGQTAYR